MFYDSPIVFNFLNITKFRRDRHLSKWMTDTICWRQRHKTECGFFCRGQDNITLRGSETSDVSLTLCRDWETGFKGWRRGCMLESSPLEWLVPSCGGLWSIEASWNCVKWERQMIQRRILLLLFKWEKLYISNGDFLSRQIHGHTHTYTHREINN